MQSGPAVGQQPRAAARDCHIATTTGVRATIGESAAPIGSPPFCELHSCSSLLSHETSPGDRTVGSIRPPRVSLTIVPER